MKSFIVKTRFNKTSKHSDPQQVKLYALPYKRKTNKHKRKEIGKCITKCWRYSWKLGGLAWQTFTHADGQHFCKITEQRGSKFLLIQCYNYIKPHLTMSEVKNRPQGRILSIQSYYIVPVHTQAYDCSGLLKYYMSLQSYQFFINI